MPEPRSLWDNPDPPNRPPSKPRLPSKPRAEKRELTIPQIRVLVVLASSRGPLSRGRIAEEAGINTTLTAWCLGRIDPQTRVAFENTKDGGYRKSLLSLGYVDQVMMDLDGTKELGTFITPAGREALKRLGDDFKLPPVRSRKAREREAAEDDGD